MGKRKHAISTYDPEYYARNKKRFSEQHKKYFEKNKEKVRAGVRAYYYRDYPRLRAELIYHYSKGSGVCIDCGESNLAILSIDHINGGGTKSRKELNGWGAMRKIERDNFKEELAVRCWVCNWLKFRKNNDLDFRVKEEFDKLKQQNYHNFFLRR